MRKPTRTLAAVTSSITKILLLLPAEQKRRLPTAMRRPLDRSVAAQAHKRGQVADESFPDLRVTRRHDPFAEAAGARAVLSSVSVGAAREPAGRAAAAPVALLAFELGDAGARAAARQFARERGVCGGPVLPADQLVGEELALERQQVLDQRLAGCDRDEMSRAAASRSTSGAARPGAGAPRRRRRCRR